MSTLDDVPPSSSSENRYRWLSAGILVLAAVLTLGLLLGAWMAGGPRESAARRPAARSVDVGFAQDMQTHHAQAVRMSVMARENTNDRDVKTLSLDVLLTQQQQIGQMFAWLDRWGLPQASARPMAWMDGPAAPEGGHGIGAGGHTSGGQGTARGGQPMMGMASKEDLQRLANARGERAERLYLQLMIPHHRGAVQMARYALEEAEQPQVRAMARKIASAQRAEIRLLRSMLAQRGGRPA